MKKTLYFIILILLFSCKTDSIPKKDIDLTTSEKSNKISNVNSNIKYVIAKSGLNYRKKPKGKIIGKFEYGEKLEIIKHSNIFDSIYEGNILTKGEWLGVKIKDGIFYTFGGYLRNKNEFELINNITSINHLFPKIVKNLTTIEAIIYNKVPYNKLDNNIAFMIYKNEHNEEIESIYAIGQIKISNKHTGYLIGKEHEYGWLEVYLRIFNVDEKRFSNDFIYLAGQEGDAGEYICLKSWFKDFNNDNIPELLQRSGHTYLDIDADEDERVTSLDDIEFMKFNKNEGTYIKSKGNFNQQKLNKIYQINLDDFLN